MDTPYLQAIQDAIQATEDEADELFTASDTQVKCIAIAINRMLSGPYNPKNPRRYVQRDIRVEVIRRIFRREPEFFNSTKQMSWHGAKRLLRLIYNRDYITLNIAQFGELDPKAIAGVWEAADGLFEQRYGEQELSNR